MVGAARELEEAGVGVAPVFGIVQRPSPCALDWTGRVLNVAAGLGKGHHRVVAPPMTPTMAVDGMALVEARAARRTTWAGMELSAVGLIGQVSWAVDGLQAASGLQVAVLCYE